MACSVRIVSGIESVLLDQSPATSSRFPFDTQTSARSRRLDESPVPYTGTATLSKEFGACEVTAGLPHQSNNQNLAHNHAAQQELAGDPMAH